MSAKREAHVPKGRRGSDPRTGRDRPARVRGRAATESAPPRRTRARGGMTSAPNREPRLPNSGPQTSPVPRPAARPARPTSTRQAKARAKARKAKAPKVVRPKLSERIATRLTSIEWRPRAWVSKVPFVVLIISSLGVGLGLTLWLSTDAAERSYQLSHARERTRVLQQQKEALERDVREAQSAPALAEAARKQGMIPTRDTAHLVQAPDGNWVVVGTPKPADGVPPPPLNTKLPEEGPSPPPQPAAAPLEVPVTVLPAPDAPPPARSGPEVLLRTPDGTATLGGGTHLPAQAGPPLPGPLQLPPGQEPMVPVAPDQVPMVPVAPDQALAPLGVVPPVPAEVPVPLQVGVAPPAVVLPGPPAAAPVPPGGEQFGPVTPTVPGAAGGAR